MENVENFDNPPEDMEEEFPKDADGFNDSGSTNYQEKYNQEKKHSELLRQSLHKCQDERRDLELQLVAGKALRDQESKTNCQLIEKNNMQFNSVIYSMKCEVETWKQKAEATCKETQLLKEQLKIVEVEKWDFSQRLTEVTEKGLAYSNFRRSFDIYTKRIRDGIQELTKQVNECQSSKTDMEQILENYRREIDVYNVHIKSFHAQKVVSIMELKVNAMEKAAAQDTGIRDMLIDKLTAAGIHQSELYAKNMQLQTDNKELTKTLKAATNLTRNVSKDQWLHITNQLDSADSTLTKLTEQAHKVLDMKMEYQNQS